jgi:hypothetical protein
MRPKWTRRHQRAHLRSIASKGGQARQAKDRAEKAAKHPVGPFPGTILDAMTAAGMVGDSWMAWRVVAKAIHTIPMTEEELAIYQRHTGRQSPPTEPVTEAWLIVGRRGGKSRFDALSALYAGIRRDYRAILAPGEQATVPIIATDRKQARTIMRYLVGLVGLPAFHPYVVRTLKESLELTTGATIEVHVASYRTIRGYTVAAAVGDELAFWATEDSAEPDSEIIAALRPAMATVPDPLLVCSSTPYARRGELFAAWERHYGQDGGDVLVWVADSRSMNPNLSAKVVQRAYEDDATAAASEYGVEGSVSFRSDVEALLSREAVEQVTVAGRLELPRVQGVQYVGFTDPSGGSGTDSYTLAIAHRDKTGVTVLDCLRELKPRFSPDAATAELAQVLKSYGCTRVTGDHWGGEWPREKFRQQGVGYEVSEQPKSDIYREVLPIINAARCALLDLPRLRQQLCGLERRVARSGKDSIDHGPGQHDDLANAACGALVLAGGGRRPGTRLIFVTGGGLSGQSSRFDSWAEEPTAVPAEWQPPEELDEHGN